jgi:hypothetical protein
MASPAKPALLVIALLCVAALAAGGQAKVPSFGQDDVELQTRAQLVANVGRWDILAELLGRTHDTEAPLHSYESVTVGSYYRVLPNLKVGALARLQAGTRHDDDVLPDPGGPTQFDWNSTASRLEGVLMLDVSPRFQLGFLPGSNWVLMVKGRYLYNTWNGQMSIMARPELTWFWMDGRDPFLNFSLSYEMYFPLNFGSSLLYQGYPYLSVLWHATPEVGIELAGAYKTTVWSSSSAWLAAGRDSYSIPVNSLNFSVGVVYTPGF